VPAFKGETIGDVFRLDPGIIALSQATGYAVWVNSAQWADLGSDYETGTILHEIIHKFGLNDGQMADALRVDIRQGSQSLSTKLMNDCVNQ
jgi:predicted Zn-dependent protease with MMP-like domain